jgi:hypothetical protein
MAAIAAGGGSLGTGVMQSVVSDKQTKKVLGQISFGLGMASLVLGGWSLKLNGWRSGAVSIDDVTAPVNQPTPWQGTLPDVDHVFSMPRPNVNSAATAPVTHIPPTAQPVTPAAPGTANATANLPPVVQVTKASTKLPRTPAAPSGAEVTLTEVETAVRAFRKTKLTSVKNALKKTRTAFPYTSAVRTPTPV